MRLAPAIALVVSSIATTLTSATNLRPGIASRQLQDGKTCSPTDVPVNCDDSVQSCSTSVSFTSCSVNCINSCNGLTFNNSTVACHDSLACQSATFRESVVNCSYDGYNLDDESCSRASFYNSAVHCGDPTFYACSQASWFQCNCCLSEGNCGTDVMSCTDPAFCSSSHLGRTCKDWGNPHCVNVDVESLPPPHPASTCLSPQVSADVVNCDTKVTPPCSGYAAVGHSTFDSCSVNCINACNNLTFTNSTVACQDQEACKYATFNMSEVSCAYDGYNLDDESCSGVKFYNSAVHCGDPTFYACSQASWFQCNCCLSEGNCGTDVMSCTDPAFCSSNFLGRTCKDWGNPHCVNVDVESLPPPHPASTCVSTQVSADVVNCDTKVTPPCSGYAAVGLSTFDSCSVNCINACNNLTFTNSTVACQDQEACKYATFNMSEVSCAYDGYNLDDESCSGAKFYNSAVNCGNPPAQACSHASWTQCNCCLSEGNCGTDVMSCTDPAFCSSIYLGRTCKDWGNPVCLTSPSMEGPVVTDNSTSPPMTAPPSTTQGPVTDDSTSPPTTAPLSTRPPTTLPPVIVDPSNPTIKPICGENNANITEGQNLTVLPCKENVNVTISQEPSNGQVTIDENGIVNYEPNPGFQGQDSFSMNTCPVDGGVCVLVTINVQVVVSEASTGSASFPYAALSALAVIPVVVIGCLLYYKKAPVDSSEKHTLPPGSAWSGARSEQAGIPYPEEASAELLHEPGQADVGYMPVNKDQARSVAPGLSAEVSGITMSLGSNNGNDFSARRAEPVGEASVYAVPDMTTNNYLPRTKDQCQEIPTERQSNDPPLAPAIIIKPEAVKGPLAKIFEE